MHEDDCFEFNPYFYTVEFPPVDTPPMWTLLLNGHFLPGPFIFPI